MSMQLPLFPVHTDWSAPIGFPDLGEVFALDLETYDPEMQKRGPSWAFPGVGRIAGVSIASVLPSGNLFKGYYPVGHQYGGNMDAGMVFRWLESQMVPGRKMVCANAVYDVGWLMSRDVRINCELHDVQIMAPLLNEHMFSFALNSLGKYYLNRSKDEGLLRDAARDFGLKNAKADMHKLPPEYVGPYAEEDALLTLDLYNAMFPKIQEEGLENVYELERSLIKILVRMRLRGVRVDLPYTEDLLRQYKLERTKILNHLKHLTGVQVDEWSADSCARALMWEGIVPPKTDKGNWSVTADWLEEQPGEVAGYIKRARKLQKAEGTFLQNGILEHHEKGRVHAQFHPLRNDEGGTISGRFSGSDPNLQQIPARDPEFGPAVRKCYLPEEGDEWCAIDYSAQEPRWTVHWAGAIDAIGADIAARKYNEDPNTDYHQMVADMCGIPRKQAKAINLGLAYGMGQLKLCKSLGLPTLKVMDEAGYETEQPGEEGERLFQLYREKVPFVPALDEECQKRAKQRGFIKTYSGRKLRFKWEKKGGRGFYAKTHTALNRLIQGSSADQMKMAIVALDREGILPLVTVHDENGFSIKDRSEAKHIAEVMCNVVKLRVPNKVDVEIGPSWGHSMLAEKFEV